MKMEIVRSGMKEVSEFSQGVGNVPLGEGTSAAAVLRDDDGKIVAFAAVQTAVHAAGSYVAPAHRGKGLTYELRKMLESELRTQGVPMYFAIPASEFEKNLFAKYGAVQERTVQVKSL
jgi:GNAT superfamily N-acetyltransferase